jgi:hypothetical protein
MANNDNIKRVGLYFNLEVEDEAKMWEYLSKKKKSYFLKNLIQNEMKNNNMNTIVIPQKTEENNLNGVDIDNSAIDFD